MISFLFDENFDDRRIIAGCNSGGKCVAKRYPQQLKGKKDWEILPIVMSGTDPFVTMDAGIIDEHSESIPINNPGIIIVRLRRPSRTMTSKLARSMLDGFKKLYSDWYCHTWDGIRLEITEMGVFLSRCVPADVPQYYIEYQSASFDAEIRTAIKRLT